MSNISNKLLEWYDLNKRTLPWRATGHATANPYHVWLSEIMLQQTTVSTVKAYFNKFTKLWPTVQDLAAAKEETVLAEWAGLGYYARARNLIKCAKLISQEKQGHFPTDEAELRKLPGIGDYTAAAISSIAFGKKAVVVDGNIERIVSRLEQIKTPIPKGKKDIKAAASLITPNKRAGDFAQSMMDLGSSICKPRNPMCDLCPIIKQCKAYRDGDMEAYPVKAPKKIKPTRRALAYWIEVDGYVLLERRPGKGLLGGMPGLLHDDWIEQTSDKAFDYNTINPPFEANWFEVDGLAKHSFTHFHLETKVMKTILNERPASNHSWVEVGKVLDYGLPTVFKKMAALALV